MISSSSSLPLKYILRVRNLAYEGREDDVTGATSHAGHQATNVQELHALDEVDQAPKGLEDISTARW